MLGPSCLSLQIAWREYILANQVFDDWASTEIGDQTLKHYDPSGQVSVDPVRDDQTVVIDTPNGLFVVLGCAHAGLINILKHISEQTGTSRFHTVLGGTHLGLVDEAQVAQTIAALREFDIGRLGAAHCTGRRWPAAYRKHSVIASSYAAWAPSSRFRRPRGPDPFRTCSGQNAP